MFRQADSNGPVRFGLVSALSLAALLYFSRKPGLQFIAFFSITGGATFLSLLKQWRQDHLARKWMRVEAQFESGTQTEIRTRREHFYRVQVSYSYSMQGSYSGGYYETYFRHEQEASRLLQDLQQNRFWIRVNPADLDQSAVIPEEL